MSRAPGARAATPVASARPFLKWAGGKRQLLPELRRFYPDRFDAYAEPFLGSGAVFFDLAARGQLRGSQVLLMDTNPDLVACYAEVRDRVDDVVRALRQLEAAHRADPRGCFYTVRDERFNPARRMTREGGGAAGPAASTLAAMLIYLNRTCFNGLFRLNATGDFNTPMGRYANPTICDEANLRLVSELLRSTGAELRLGDFSDVAGMAGPRTFVYFDPPYVPLSRTANFRSYTAGGFADAEQERLQRLVIALAARGARVLVSNSVTPLTTRLYQQSRAARRVGLSAHRVPARRTINSRATSRGAIDEYLVTNIVPADGRGASCPY